MKESLNIHSQLSPKCKNPFHPKSNYNMLFRLSARVISHNIKQLSLEFGFLLFTAVTINTGPIVLHSKKSNLR